VPCGAPPQYRAIRSILARNCVPVVLNTHTHTHTHIHTHITYHIRIYVRTYVSICLSIFLLLYLSIIHYFAFFLSLPFLLYSNTIFLSAILYIYSRNGFCLSIYGWTALVDLGRVFSFLICTQPVGLLGRGISPSQGHAYTQNNTKTE
jgi:hypothetical protein